MIIGIASLVLACCFQGLSFPFGVVAAVLGIIARRQITRSAGAQTGLGQALTGILTGVLSSLLIGGVLFAWLVLGVWEPIPLN